jgi:hypothetical protein
MMNSNGSLREGRPPGGLRQGGRRCSSGGNVLTSPGTASGGPARDAKEASCNSPLPSRAPAARWAQFPHRGAEAALRLRELDPTKHRGLVPGRWGFGELQPHPHQPFTVAAALASAGGHRQGREAPGGAACGWTPTCTACRTSTTGESSWATTTTPGPWSTPGATVADFDPARLAFWPTAGTGAGPAGYVVARGALRRRPADESDVPAHAGPPIGSALPLLGEVGERARGARPGTTRPAGS